jgi:general secretion pathway protein K
LALVLGLPPVLVDRALPYLTVYSGQAEINVLNAVPPVLAALPGLTPDRLHDLLASREGVPLDVLRARLGLAARYVTVQPSIANRLQVVVAIGPNHRIHYEIVIVLLKGDREPYRVLSWHDRSEMPGG